MHESRLVGIAHWGFAIWQNPFGMLCPQVAVNLLPEVRDRVGFSHFLAFILSFGKFWRTWQKSLQDTADTVSPKRCRRECNRLRDALQARSRDAVIRFRMRRATGLRRTSRPAILKGDQLMSPPVSGKYQITIVFDLRMRRTVSNLVHQLLMSSFDFTV